MSEFWIGAALLVLLALSFLLLPLLRSQRTRGETSDRTAANVALYEEHLVELDLQHRAGELSDAQLQSARTEAARELLQDTDAPRSRVGQGALGRAVPATLAALLVVMAVGLYWHWGALDDVRFTRELATQPGSAEEVIRRLERATAMQPDSAEGWYMLGRAYMDQNQPARAVKGFERAIGIAGQRPELLGQLLQAVFFATGRQWSAELQKLADAALAADPSEPTTLGVLGIAAFEGRQFRQAIDYWQRLLAVLPAGDASRTAIEGGIRRAEQELGSTAVPAPAAAVELQVSVSLAEQVQAGLDDTVFIFARAVNGAPMPLAVRRLQVRDLPATITLTDADAVLPNLHLSGVARVQVAARISRSGDVAQGEWFGYSGPVSLETAEIPPVSLVIDRAEPEDS